MAQSHRHSHSQTLPFLTKNKKCNSYNNNNRNNNNNNNNLKTVSRSQDVLGKGGEASTMSSKYLPVCFPALKSAATGAIASKHRISPIQLYRF